MQERTVTVMNASGLHARPAAVFVGAAKKFADTKIWVVKGDNARDAKSILAVLTMGVTKGTTVVLRADGPSEQQAVDELFGLIEAGLGEGH
jgi:phosphocarrier protein HPr